VAAVVILALAGPLAAAQAPTTTATTAAADITGSLRPAAGTDHELRIEVTRPGSEALTLGARLKAGGGLIARPIDWTIRHSLGSGGGDIVWHSLDPLAETPLAPGDYIIEAAYGAAKFLQPVSITPGQRMVMTFILNVGGIRPLSRIDGVGYPSSLPATHTVYALTGPAAGKQVADDIEQGEIVRVAAGSYRIESRFADGNTVAETKVTVKPGILTSIEISHLASFAQVTIPAAAGRPVTWRIRQTAGDWQRAGKGDTFALILAPGTYEVKAAVGGHDLTSQFTLKPNDIKHLTVGQ
jgi:hypothetical protein